MGWTINNLSNDLVRLKRLYNKETDLTRKQELSTYIYCLEEMITNLSYKNNIKYTGYNAFYRALYSIPRYRMYYPHIEEFLNILSKYRVDMEERTVYVDKFDHSRKELFDMTKDFYQHIGGKTFEKYLEFDKQKRNRVNYSSIGTPTTYYVPGVDKFYLNIVEFKDGRDTLEGLIHEVGHIITAKMNEKRYNSDDIFVEIETLFYEILADDYFYNKTGDITFKLFEQEKVDNYHLEGDLLDISAKAFEKVMDNSVKIDNPDKAYNKICKYMGLMNPKEVEIDKYMRYTISYICAVELYEIYKQDKETALHLLENIISENKGIIEYEKITKNITPCEHLDHYVKELKKS